MRSFAIILKAIADGISDHHEFFPTALFPIFAIYDGTTEYDSITWAKEFIG